MGSRPTSLSCNRPNIPARLPCFSRRSFSIGKTFEEIQAMAVDPLSNDACRGYVIWDNGKSRIQAKEITQAVTELYTAFDFRPLKKWPGIIIIVLFTSGQLDPKF